MTGFKNCKKDFPIFSHHPDLVYLDNAATTHKPQQVIDSIQQFYTQGNANIHRGIYDLSAQATINYDQTRNKVQSFLNAPTPSNIVFTKGTTDAINLVANSFLLPHLKKDDEVIISAMEHHANLIPWQMACKIKRAHLRVIPMDKKGELDLKQYQSLLNTKTKLVAIVHVSNSLGTINPIEEMIDLAHQKDIPILIDGAQSAAHFPIDVQSLNCDFYIFSGHKIFGPTGVGALYGKTVHLEEMPPYQFGGDMIKDVRFEETQFANAPQKFEAGTPNIAGVIGMGAAIDFIQQFDKKDILLYQKELNQYAREQMGNINGLKIIGTAQATSSIVSFMLQDVHAHDIASFLNEDNIAIRAGHHCTQPVMDFFQISGTTRASFTIYNSKDDVDKLVHSIKNIQSFFA